MIAELLGLSRRERRYDGFALENPNLPLNDPGVWEQVFNDSWGTDTGDPMSAARAMRYAPVWQAVSLISGDVAKLPLNLYRRRPNIGEDARELDSDDPRQRLVKVMANEEVNAVKFWRRLMVHALLWGNGYAWIERDAVGEPVGLVNLLPDRTAPERINGDLYYVTEANGKLHVMLPSNVLHIEGLGYEGGVGINLVQTARDSFALGLAQQKFASKFFRNGARVGGILELPQAMQKAARDTIEDGFRKTYEGGDNPFKTVILRDGAKFHAAQTSPRDSQLTDATEGQVRQVARWFNLQPSKLGLSDSVSYNSKAEDNQAYLDSTLSIWLLLICTECNTKLLSLKEQSKRFFEHNANALLRLNQYQRYQAYRIGITSRFLNPNEVRARENMLPYDGGDEFMNPNPGAALPGEVAPEPEKEPETPPEKKPDADEANRNRVLFGLTKLARHRASKGGASFCDWLDHDLPAERKEAIELLGSDNIVSMCIERFKGVAARATPQTLTAAVEILSAKIERGE